jgi:hypothetical protein
MSNFSEDSIREFTLHLDIAFHIRRMCLLSSYTTDMIELWAAVCQQTIAVTVKSNNTRYRVAKAACNNKILF